MNSLDDPSVCLDAPDTLLDAPPPVDAGQKLEWLQSLAVAAPERTLRITRDDLLYIIGNHDTSDAMVAAFVDAFLGRPF